VDEGFHGGSDAVIITLHFAHRVDRVLEVRHESLIGGRVMPIRLNE
jgi:hypothetical protein